MNAAAPSPFAAILSSVLVGPPSSRGHPNKGKHILERDRGCGVFAFDSPSPDDILLEKRMGTRLAKSGMVAAGRGGK